VSEKMPNKSSALALVVEALAYLFVFLLFLASTFVLIDLALFGFFREF